MPPVKLFFLAPNVGTKGHSLNLVSNHIRPEVRKLFFAQKVNRAATVGCETLEGSGDV